MKIYLLLLSWLAFASGSTIPATGLIHGEITSTKSTSPFDSGTLQGHVQDENGENLIGATVKVSQGQHLIRGCITDVDGKYRLLLDPGIYDVEVNYTGYTVEKKAGVAVLKNEINVMDFILKTGVQLEAVEIKEYKVPLIKNDASSSGSTISRSSAKPAVRREAGKAKQAADKSPGRPRPSQSAPTADEIRRMPTRNINAVIPASPNTATNYKIEDRFPLGAPPPVEDIEKLHVITPTFDSTIESTAEQYNTIVENPYQNAQTNSISTFSIDVDAASYANVRRFLQAGQLPPKDAVRIEEMVNYFDYDYPQPKAQHPFVVSTDLSPCPWAPDHRLLLLGLQGQNVDVGQLPAANLVFLIDVSGSMDEPDKLPLVQQSLELLTDQLRPTDRVAIVVYAGAAGTVLESTPGTAKVKIKEAINRLQAGGSTAGGEGILLAYNTARKNLIPNGNNRVILCTDGDFNVGISNEKELVKLIEQERTSGVYLTVLGFGTGNYQDGKMQMLADKGNGNHAYIDGLKEAQKVLVQEFGGTLFAIAKDVKLQVHFNPAQVAGYRLIGYENRMLATEDFNDDTKDAGELGAGHRVTALYEIVPLGQALPAATKSDSVLLSVVKPDTAVVVHPEDLLVLQLRYKQPKGEQPSQLMEYRLPASALHQMTESNNLLLASAVVEFGLLLRDSKYKGSATYNQTLARARAAAKNDPGGYRQELVQLIEQAQRLATTR